MLIQDCKWPGVAAVAACRGTVSHGITPGTFVLTTYPQAGLPAVFGDLLFSDGGRSVRLRGCKLHLLTGSAGPDGQTYTLEILDRRWRWQGLGAVDGNYNQVDTNGKLVPWSIRSPAELARLCLDAMGETNYLIDLPAGLSRADGKDLDRYLRLGENFRQSLANPPVVWDRTPPAQALARLCDYFGRRVVYEVTTDRVVIAQLGVGQGLPEMPSELIAPGVKVPETPAAVGVAGLPRFQARFALEAVGKEWSGQFVPINELSYAPVMSGAKQVTTVTLTGPTPPASIELRFSWQTAAGRAEDAAVKDTDPGHTAIADRWAALAAAVAADPKLDTLVAVTSAGRALTLTGRRVGQAFGVQVLQPLGEEQPAYRLATATPAGPNGPTWAYSPPPMFAAVRPTEQLTRQQAIELARQWVWRAYRIKAVSPFTGLPPLKLPWYGPVTRRQQVVLQPTKVQQVTPMARIGGGTNKVQIVQPGSPAGILPEYYNGYSRDQQAVVYGSVYRLIGSVLWNPPADPGTKASAWNTKATDRVYVGFTIDPVEQLVVFDEPVYASDGGTLWEPELVLETGCLVKDPDTDQVVRWLRSAPLGGDAPAQWEVKEDIQVGVIGKYTDDHGLIGYELFEAGDAEARARYYLTGLTVPHRLAPGQTRQYPGIIPLNLNGAIQQVTWSVGPDGPTTVASSDCEHSAAVPTYPARRRAENLPPNKAAAAANLAERQFADALIPKPPSATR